jgi:1D-myo-inositol 3-kinase
MSADACRSVAGQDADDYMRRADAIVLSREDVGGDERIIAELASKARLLVITDGWHGAVLYEGGAGLRVPARPAREVDPTGAGDVFAAAFLVRLFETGTPVQAVRFANIVASMSVEGWGIEAIPYRAQVDAWLAREESLS